LVQLAGFVLRSQLARVLDAAALAKKPMSSRKAHETSAPEPASSAKRKAAASPASPASGKPRRSKA
jgi:hypothetical protein